MFAATLASQASDWDVAISFWLLNGPPWQVGFAGLLLSLLLARFTLHWIERLQAFDWPWGFATCAHCGTPHCSASVWLPLVGAGYFQTRCAACGLSRKPIAYGELGITGLLWAVFWFVGRQQVQNVVEGGSIDWIHWRVLFHLALVSLLVIATATDLQDYTIADSVTYTGTLLGILGATAIGNLQMLPSGSTGTRKSPEFADRKFRSGLGSIGTGMVWPGASRERWRERA